MGKPTQSLRRRLLLIWTSDLEISGIGLHEKQQSFAADGPTSRVLPTESPRQDQFPSDLADGRSFLDERTSKAMTECGRSISLSYLAEEILGLERAELTAGIAPIG